jgi:hypothetical protein
MNNDTYYIVAGNYGEFCSFTERNRHTGLFYRYVDNYNTIVGLSEIKGFYVGTWRTRPDIDLIQSRIAVIKSKNLHRKIKPSTPLP